MDAQDQRPRFYEGQYLGAADLSAALEYARLQQARHALGAHTWGIALGLYLLERPSPGAPDRRDVFLQPGYGWDGFGRPLVLGAPLRLSELDFAAIPYTAARDDVAAGGKGRLVKVWITYDEQRGGNPPPGFENCEGGDQQSRVKETFRLVIGEQTALVDRRAPVTIAARTMDAADALSKFDAAAPPLFDASVPHQTFPTAPRPPRWLVPIGYVRWIAAANGVGSFARRDLEPADHAEDRIRSFRRYLGVVTENLEAADGAIVLRRRGDDPTASHRFARLLQSESLAALGDLVWVEGGLRVEGDLRLAGGRLLFRDGDGHDQNAALQIERAGDDTGVDGNRQLRVVLGPAGQSDNRLVVGRQAGAGVAPQFVVVSDGDVGVGTSDPAVRLHVKGDRARLEDEANSKRLTLSVAGDPVEVVSETRSLAISATGAVATQNAVLINPTPPAADQGRVGVRVAQPQYTVDVKASSIKLGLEEAGGGQLVLKNNANDNRIWLEAFSRDGGDHATEMLLTGRNGANAPKISILADIIQGRGRLGINTDAPAQQVHVLGGRIRLEDAAQTKEIDLRADGGAVDLQASRCSLYLRSSGNHDVIVNPFAGDGRVGIGTETPRCKLHVVGNVAGDASNVANHVVLIDNAAGNDADVLALRVGTPATDGDNNFITFFSSVGPIGRIEATDATHVAYRTSGADFAECFELAAGARPVSPGEVVGVSGGRVSPATGGAQHVGVVSGAPGFVGNDGAGEDGRRRIAVAMLGQVPVKVRGRVRAGDLLVPSGEGDGVAVAVAPGEARGEQLARVVGTAWESAEAPDVKLVRAAVGVASRDAIGALAARVEMQQARLEALEAAMARLGR
jgi:hypothetical protein